MQKKLKPCSKCDRPSVIFKNEVTDGIRYSYCSSCIPKKKAKTPNKKIASRSKKKIEEDKEYSIKRKEYLLAHPKCEINFPNCQSEATEVHHTQYRTGTNYLDESTWKSSCFSCHKSVHSDPLLAKERGFL